MTKQSHPPSSTSASGRVTPPPLPVPAPDTHVAPRRTSGVKYRSGHLQSSRTAVLEDLGPVLVLPVTILPHLLPRIASDPVLSLKDIKELHSLGDRWKLWPADPVETSGHEDRVFTALPLLFQSIVDSYRANPTAELMNNPTKAPDSMRSNSSRPDGYFLRKPAAFALEKREVQEGLGDFWEDIAIPCEYKKSSQISERNDNERKIIWSMHHILRNDPCRRFTYGITVENTDMRLWLSHRAVTLVTASFNFITDQDNLVNLVTSLAFAGNVALGWDPTLRRREQGLNRVYEIDVNTGPSGQIQTFTADQIISDFGAEAMQGRGTRVFRAKDKHGSTVVVKDMWQDHDRAKEGDILQEIKQRMQDDKEVDFDQDKKLFLSVVCHGVVHIWGVPDHTLHLIMNNIAIPPGCESFQVLPPGKNPDDIALGGHKGSFGHVPLVPERLRTYMGTKRADASQIYHRLHYRIVFAELGQSLHEIYNLQQTFQVLEDATRALKLLHRYNFVHRDVSAGNILSVDGHGVLADLEYAKRLSDNSQHDVRTGTVYFMAAEVASQEYLFATGEWKTKLPPFKHNALHDIESLWWVGTWSLFTRGLPEYSGSDNLEDHRRVCLDLFPHYVDDAKRALIIAKSTIFRIKTFSLLVPFHPAAGFMSDALVELSACYERVEKGPKMNMLEISGIHDVFDKHLRSAKNCAPGNVVRLEDVKGIEPLAKRARLE